MFDLPEELQIREINLSTTNYAIVRMVDHHEYDGRLAVAYKIIYPSPFNHRQSIRIEDFIDCRDYGNGSKAIKKQLTKQLRHFTENVSQYESLTYYNFEDEDISLMYWKVDDERANDESLVIFCFWSPDQGAADICINISSLASYLWKLHVASVTSQ